jgi:hypothetical protein
MVENPKFDKVLAKEQYLDGPLTLKHMKNTANGNDISWANGYIDILFEFLAKWHKSIQPVDLAGYLHGNNTINIFLDNNHHGNDETLIAELKTKLLSDKKSLSEFKQFIKRF